MALMTLGERSFQCIGPGSGTLSLSLSGLCLHSLTSKLKTHLFSSAYWSVISFFSFYQPITWNACTCVVAVVVVVVCVSVKPTVGRQYFYDYHYSAVWSCFLFTQWKSVVANTSIVATDRSRSRTKLVSTLMVLVMLTVHGSFTHSIFECSPNPLQHSRWKHLGKTVTKTTRTCIHSLFVTHFMTRWHWILVNQEYRTLTGICQGLKAWQNAVPAHFTHV